MSLLHDSFKTLLPNNESQKQKDLDFLAANVSSRINLEDLTLLPTDTHVHLLKHLAYMYDINIDGLIEKEQRKLIEKSFDIHRHLGTSYALKEALKVIGVEAETLEWYETDGELAPYHFGLTLNSMDNRGTEFLLNYIERFKNLRSRLAKLSDGKCKSKAKYDTSKYDDALYSDVEGLLLNGVRVCFRGSKDKEVKIDYRVSAYAVSHLAKITYFFKNRYDNLRYGERRESFSVATSILSNIDKQMKIKRNWQGTWTGHVTDVYVPSFLTSVSISKEVELQVSVSSLMEAFINREASLVTKVSSQNRIDKELKLQRNWQGTWTGHVTDAYAVAIL